MNDYMKKVLENPVLQLLLRMVVGIMFFYAAIGKIAEPATFAKEIANYNLLFENMINIMALTLPWIELVIGIFLIAGIRLKASSTIAGLLLIVFIVAVGSAMARNLDINCGCFGRMIQKVGWGKILENSLLLAASVLTFSFPIQKLSIEHLLIKQNGKHSS